MVVVVVLTSKVLQQEECQVTLGKEDGDCVAGEKKVLPLQRECQRCVVVRSGNTRILGDFFSGPHTQFLLVGKRSPEQYGGAKEKGSLTSGKARDHAAAPFFSLR